MTVNLKWIHALEIYKIKCLNSYFPPTVYVLYTP